MKLPARVSRYFQDQVFANSTPCCFSIDHRFRLARVWGDAGKFGLSDVEAGADMRETCPFLAGLSTDEVQVMRFVGTPQQRVAHVHLVPGKKVCYVLLLDASEEHSYATDRQQSMNELKLMHARQVRLISRQRDLISELVETRSELDHLRRNAERESENKSRFIAMMSHEFRTPLASIVNYSELACGEGATPNDIQKSIETIERSARHMTSLVEALLDDASLAAGRIELQQNRFDCHALLEDVATMMAPMAAEKGLAFAVQVDTDVPRVAHADEVRLRQVLINLLGNAVKFTAEGSVRLLAAYANHRLILTVTDTGPGISLADQERVFQAFERGGHHHERGAGLGLTITLRLVQLMGGEVSLDSLPGEGCTVSVHVPVGIGQTEHPRPEAVLPRPADDAMASQPLSVLVCDDDEDMVALIEHYLHRSGYGLITTSDTSDAIAKTIKYDPDLVLMDCNVPGIGGVDAARLLRQRGYNKPIVALTASRLGDEEIGAFTRFFRKPAAMDELLSEIRRLTH